jgi:hypothetical protein
MKKAIITMACCLPLWAAAQRGSSSDAPLYSVNEGTLIGIGRYDIGNTYLSPSSDASASYTGMGLRVLNERMRLVDTRISSQQMLHVDLSYTSNPAATISAMSGVIDYSYGYHYRFMPVEGLRILAGASARGMFGFIYNTQSANNPTALNFDIDLNLSAAALYTLRLRNWPLTFRYQAEAPCAGVLFAPDYGQSYYEIFGLGNMTDVVRFSSLHNKQVIRNYLTVDIPLRRWTLRAGYMNSLYRTDINSIRSHHYSHSFMVGLVKEFISFGGRDLRKKHSFQSAYY